MTKERENNNNENNDDDDDDNNFFFSSSINHPLDTKARKKWVQSKSQVSQHQIGGSGSGGDGGRYRKGHTVDICFPTHTRNVYKYIKRYYFQLSICSTDKYDKENLEMKMCAVCVYGVCGHDYVVPILRSPFTFALTTGCGEPFSNFSDFSSSSVCCSPFSASRNRRSCFFVRSFWKNNRI